MLEDDALIVFRYAMNFHWGHGWVMNPGELVNGCTAPLHLMLVTLLLGVLTPDGAVAALKLLGMAAGVGVVLMTKRIGDALFPGTLWPGALAAFCVAVRPEFAVSTTNCLETPFATLLLLLGISSLIRVDGLAQSESSPLPWREAVWVGSAFAGAALERPELTVALPAFLLTLLPGLLWRQKKMRSAFALSLIAFTLPVAVWVGFSTWFYGDPLPNTFYAKHIPGLGIVPSGLHYVFARLLPPLPIAQTLFQLGLPNALLYWYGLPIWGIGTAVASLAALALGGGRYGRGISAILGLHVLFLLHTDGDWMVDGRFATVVLPLAALSWAAALLSVWRAACRRAGYDGGPWPRSVTGRTLPLTLYPLAAALLIAGVLVEGHAGAALITSRQNQGGAHPVSNAELARWWVGTPMGVRVVADWINGHVAPGQTVLSSENGLIPFLCPSVRFVDAYGLTDRTIARLPGYQHSNIGVITGRYWADPHSRMGRYVALRHPDWVILLDALGEPTSTPGYRRVTTILTGLRQVSGDAIQFYVWARTVMPPATVQQKRT